MLEDRRLIGRLKRGDKDALRQLYEKYKDDLLTIAISLLHEVGAAEEILHDVFVSFAAGIGGFELRSSLRQYLITCVVNRVRDRFRRKKYEVVELDRVGPVSSKSDRPEQSVMFSEETQLLTDALVKIPFNQREVIILRLQAGMKFREIAAAQGVPISTVQGRYRYGLDKLRSLIRGEAIR
ncbi:MAG: RNA polymerase sigma factor [Planctomycetota bacterium]|jgi:RNA polymerase sigma-70 factor (ECF subfamily)